LADQELIRKWRDQSESNRLTGNHLEQVGEWNRAVRSWSRAAIYRLCADELEAVLNLQPQGDLS
jgi:hypothetical protein